MSKRKRKAKEAASQKDSAGKRRLKKFGAVAAATGSIVTPVVGAVDVGMKVSQAFDNNPPPAYVEPYQVDTEGPPDEMADKSRAVEGILESLTDGPTVILTPSTRWVVVDPDSVDFDSFEYSAATNVTESDLDSQARSYMKFIESGAERKKPIALAGLATVSLQQSIGMPQVEKDKALERASQLYAQALSEEHAQGRADSTLTQFTIRGLAVATPDKDRSDSEEQAQIRKLALSFFPHAMSLLELDPAQDDLGS